MLESISSKTYIRAFVFIAIVLVGIASMSTFSAPTVSDAWTVDLPATDYVAHDEFIPVSFSYTPGSGLTSGSRDGNFSILLESKKNGTKTLLPLYPRELSSLIERDAANAVHVGGKEYPLGVAHTFSGVAYLSPLAFDGDYVARVVFAKTEEGKSPSIISQDVGRPFVIKRTFQTRKSLDARALSQDVRKNSDGTYTILRFSLGAVVDDVLFRGFEAGVPGIRRVPDPVMSLVLYDAKTGQKISDLTNTKVGAQTIERFTPYVLDSDVLIQVGQPRELELRAVIDSQRLDSNGNISFTIPRLYGINTEQHKVAEQVPLKVTGVIRK